MKVYPRAVRVFVAMHRPSRLASPVVVCGPAPVSQPTTTLIPWFQRVRFGPALADSEPLPLRVGPARIDPRTTLQKAQAYLLGVRGRTDHSRQHPSLQTHRLQATPLL